MKKETTLKQLKSKERDKRKILIIEAAERVFVNKPYNKVSMQEIAREAGLAKSSIYTYFPNQESLFLETFLRDLALLMEDFNTIISGEGEVNLGDLISTFIDHFDRHDSFFRMASLFMLHGNLSEASQKRLNQAGRQMMDLFDLTFKAMNYRGDVRLLSHTLFAALGGIMISYKKYPGRSDEEIKAHMRKIGRNVKQMLEAFIRERRRKSGVEKLDRPAGQ